MGPVAATLRVGSTESFGAGASLGTHQPAWARLLFTIVVAAAVSASCSNETAPIASAARGFAILSTNSGLVLADGAHSRALPSFQSKEGNWGAADAVWREAGLAVVVFGDVIGLVDADGERRTAGCLRCLGVALAGDTAITIRPNYRPGDGFELVEFDSDLRQIRTTPAARLNERWLGVRIQENPLPPMVLAADGDSVYLTHASRLSGARSGTEIVARYSRSGERQDYLRIDGLARKASLSPDKRLLALSAGGSGGACVEVNRLRVVDLEQMRELETYPDLPVEYMTASGNRTQPWFTIEELDWTGGDVVVFGEMNSPPGNEICDSSPQTWIRTYHIGTQSFSDRRADEQPQDIRAPQVIGPGCSDVIGYAGIGDQRRVIGIKDGVRTEFATRTAILAATAGRLSC